MYTLVFEHGIWLLENNNGMIIGLYKDPDEAMLETARHERRVEVAALRREKRYLLLEKLMKEHRANMAALQA